MMASVCGCFLTVRRPYPKFDGDLTDFALIFSGGVDVIAGRVQYVGDYE